MASPTVANPPGRSVSKGSKKKKNSSDVSTNPPSVVDAGDAAKDSHDEHHVNGNTTGESPQVKEIHRQLRNVNKKLVNIQKVDVIVAANPGKSLDQLVAERKINADQKAQLLKKPEHETHRDHLQQLLSTIEKLNEQFQGQLKVQKEALEAAHKTELADVKAIAAAEATTEAEKRFESDLLILSKFLRAAAARRHQLQLADDSQGTEDDKAFEGALLLVYGGDEGAVASMKRLIAGGDEKVPSIDETLLEVTYDQVKQLSLNYSPFATEEQWVEGVAQADDQETSPVIEEKAATESTVAEPAAAATAVTQATDSKPQPTDDATTVKTAAVEVDTLADKAPTENVLNKASITSQGAAPQQISVETAGNEAAEASWSAVSDHTATAVDAGMSSSWENIEAPRDPAETETGLKSTPVAITAPAATQSWSDEVHEYVAATPVAKPEGDFQTVQHHRGGRGRGGFQGDGRGGYRGRGGHRGDFRNRSYRGDHRGRGRGGFRGGRGRNEVAQQS